MKKLVLLTVLCCFALASFGCAKKRDQGAIDGALLGAATGAVASSPTIVGAGLGLFVGGVIGACVGNEVDRRTDPTLYSTCKEGDKCVEPLAIFEDKDVDGKYYMVYKDSETNEFKILTKNLKDPQWKRLNQD